MPCATTSRSATRLVTRGDRAPAARLSHPPLRHVPAPLTSCASCIASLTELGYSLLDLDGAAWGLREGPVFDALRPRGAPGLGHGLVAARDPRHLVVLRGARPRPHAGRLPRRRRSASPRPTRPPGPGLINIYGDPSHIHGEDEFFDGIAAIAAVAKPSSYARSWSRSAMSASAPSASCTIPGARTSASPRCAPRTPRRASSGAARLPREPALARVHAAICSPRRIPEAELVRTDDPGWEDRVRGCRRVGPALPRRDRARLRRRSSAGSHGSWTRRRSCSTAAAARSSSTDRRCARCACAARSSGRWLVELAGLALIALATPALVAWRPAARPAMNGQAEVREWWAEQADDLRRHPRRGRSGRPERRSWARREFFDEVDRRFYEWNRPLHGERPFGRLFPYDALPRPATCSRSAAGWARWR